MMMMLSLSFVFSSLMRYVHEILDDGETTKESCSCLRLQFDVQFGVQFGVSRKREMNQSSCYFLSRLSVRFSWFVVFNSAILVFLRKKQTKNQARRHIKKNDKDEGKWHEVSFMKRGKKEEQTTKQPKRIQDNHRRHHRILSADLSRSLFLCRQKKIRVSGMQFARHQVKP